MRRKTKWLVAIAAAVGLGISCSDSPTSPRNTGTQAPGGCAVDLSSLRAMPATVFGSGTSAAAAVRARIDTIEAALTAGNVALAQSKAHELVAYIHDNAAQARGTPAQLDNLVNTILCWVGLPETSFIVPPSTEAQVLKTTDGSAGVAIPANGVSEPTVITITVVEGHLLTTDDTKLDRYPLSVSVTSSVPVANSTVGVCLTNIPASVLPRLRMGHRTKDGFRIEPPAPVDFLHCGEAGASGAKGAVRRALSVLGRFLLPKVLYAKQDGLLSGGVGGTAGEYSPFEPVDTELSFSGGVGGTAGEYLRFPALQSANGACQSADAPVGAPVAVECRPRVLVTTANGTVLQNVPVTWTVPPGDGAVALENSSTRACGPFGETAAAVTNVNGLAGVCWTLGTTAGANALVATVGVGGDAPPGVGFSQVTQNFTVSALPITPTATATGETASFDGSPHGGSGSCSHGLVPSFSYGGDGSVPVNVGTYTLTVTCGSGNANFNVAFATAAIVITPSAPSIQITCPASVVFTSTAQAPCNAIVTGPSFGATVSLTYSANVNVGAASVTATLPAGANHAGATAAGGFQITPAATTTIITCPESVVYTGSPITPCSAFTTGPGLSETNTPVYSNNTAVGTASASYTFEGTSNYLGSFGSEGFRITLHPAPR